MTREQAEAMALASMDDIKAKTAEKAAADKAAAEAAEAAKSAE